MTTVDVCGEQETSTAKEWRGDMFGVESGGELDDCDIWYCV